MPDNRWQRLRSQNRDQLDKLESDLIKRPFERRELAGDPNQRPGERVRTRNLRGSADGQEETFDVIGPGHTYESVTEKIASLILNPRISIRWLAGLGLAATFTGLLGFAVLLTVLFGVGLWGNNIPVAWAFGIINFVWWIGFGHAGTFISAILLLVHQNWRTAINRFAEAMTIFAV